MFGENASFIKSVEIDNSIFECDPQCSEKYLLQLEWSKDNEARQWRVLKKEDVLSSSWSNESSANQEVENLQQTISEMQQLIVDLTARVAALEA